MKISVDWMDGYVNFPHFMVLGAPKRAWIGLWEKRETLHRRDDPNGFVQYFSTDGRPTEGFGGRIFEGELTDGTAFKYRGAWSSRAAGVNCLWPESPIVDVFTDDHMATAMTVERLITVYLSQTSGEMFRIGVVDDRDMAPILMALDAAGQLRKSMRAYARVLVTLEPDGSNLSSVLAAFRR